MSAAEDGNDAATRMHSQAQYFGWLGMGDRHRNCLHRHWPRRGPQRGPTPLVRPSPRTSPGGCSPYLERAGWFPGPGGLVNYVLLPFWLVAAFCDHRPSPESASLDSNQTDTVAIPRDAGQSLT